jgi:putative transposase
MSPTHERKNMSLHGNDPAQTGGYFVTLVVKDRELLFGEITDGVIAASPIGEIVLDTWAWLSRQYPYVVMGDYCLMPNHFHGIIRIEDPGGGGSRAAAAEEPIKIKPLGQIIGAFKTVSTKRTNLLRGTPSQALWQNNYSEHILRGPDDLARAQEYIANNPARWLQDSEYPR